MPAISVIIPVYNAAEYLHKCLDSIINQTFTDLEIICVNDCSRDNSLEILREYEEKDSRIKVVDCERNNRQAVARNIGMKMATGKYIAFVDADDWLNLDRFERLFREAEMEKVAIALSGCLCEYEDGCVRFVNRLTSEKRLLSGLTLAKEVISGKVSAGASWHGIYSSFLLKNGNIIFQSIRSEDYIFNMEAYTRADKVCLLPDCDYHYRALVRSDSRGAVSPGSLLSVKGLERCICYLSNNDFLRGKIRDYDDFIDIKSLSEFCTIIINECSLTSLKSFSEKCAVVKAICENVYFRGSSSNKNAILALRLRQRLLIRHLLTGHFKEIVACMMCKDFLSREYYRIKNYIYRLRHFSPACTINRK